MPARPSKPRNQMASLTALVVKKKNRKCSPVERDKIKKVTQVLPDSDLFWDLHLDFRTLIGVRQPLIGRGLLAR